MATETQYPDSILASTGWSGSATTIDDDVDSPGGDWIMAPANNSDPSLRVSFPTPTGSPTVGADLQTFRVWVRKNRNKSGVPTCQIALWENGSLVRAGSAQNVTNLTGEEFSFTWNANELGTADGSLVECRVICVHGGTGPSDDATVDIDAVNWDVDYTAAAINRTPSAAPSAAAAVSPALAFGAITRSPSPAVTSSSATAVTVVLGEVTRAPQPATTTVAAVSAGLAFGGIARGPPPAVSLSVAVTPDAFIPGTYATPVPAASAVAAVSPAVALGALTVSPSPASAGAAAVSPAVTSDWVATPQPASSTTAGVSPTTALGALSVSPGPAASAAAATVPVAAFGGISITASPAASQAAAVTPGLAGLEWYTRGKWGVLSGNIDLQVDSIRVMLVGTGYTFDSTHNVVNDVVAQELAGAGYSRQTLTGKGVTEDDAGGRAYFDATNVQWTGLTVSQVKGVIIYQFVTDDSDSRLIAALIYPNGPTPSDQTLTVEWNDAGILEIG